MSSLTRMAVAVLASVSGTQALPGTPKLDSRQATRCDATVLSSGLPSGVKVTFAGTSVPGSADQTYLMNQAQQPGLCAVNVQITSQNPAGTTNFGLLLPVKANWNQRIITYGN